MNTLAITRFQGMAHATGFKIWPLVSVAIALDRAPGAKTVRDARVVMGAVAPVPFRAHAAEAVLKGGPLDESRARAAAEAALKDARPMSDNAYKVVIAKVIVRRAIMGAAGLEAA